MTEPRLRVLMGSSIAMGPGKADLLQAIADAGSITRAARHMGMSYRRAWLLVETMNLCFRAPLVAASRGGAGGGLGLSGRITQGISGESGPFGRPEVGLAQALPIPFPFGAGEDCMSHSVTQLTVINNSFSDSERDGIAICCGGFQLEEFGIKSVISNNVIEGNGDDGIDIESSIGLNIGPGTEIFENGTNSNDNGIEIDWCLGLLVWFGGAKVPANSNTITKDSM